MLPEMPHASPSLVLHIALLYSGGALFVLGICPPSPFGSFEFNQSLKELLGVIMSVIGALLIFMSFVCLDTGCAEEPSQVSQTEQKADTKPHPPTVEEIEAGAIIELRKSLGNVQINPEEERRPVGEKEGAVRRSQRRRLGALSKGFGGLCRRAFSVGGCHYK